MSAAEQTETEVPFEDPDTVPELDPEQPQPDEEEEATETEPTPEEPDTDPDAEPEGRCEAQTTVGGTPYRCSLDAMHEGEHQFQPLDTTDTGEEQDAGLEAFRESQKRIAGYVSRYEKALREEMGPEFEALAPCPLCPEQTPGFIFPGMAYGISEEARVAVRAAIGDEDLSEYRDDPYRKVCETCGGRGNTKVDVFVPSERTHKCDDCAGKGWQRTSKTPPAGQVAEVVAGPWPAAEAVEQAEEDPLTQPDPWGTPPGAPYFGVMLNLRPEGWEQEVAAWKAANGVS